MHFPLSQEAADWVNRVGMILGFLAFWFAAPELLGEQRLKKWEKPVEAGVGLLPPMAGCVASCLFYALAMVVLVGCMVLWNIDFPWSIARFSWFNYRSVLGAYLSLTFWVTVMFVGVGTIYRLAETTKGPIEKAVLGGLVEPILRRLANDANIRIRSLVLGAVFFVLGFVLQFTSTFQSPIEKPRPEPMRFRANFHLGQVIRPNILRLPGGQDRSERT